tara:strand:+ start:335 stop:730 length:396 start_codon:yes stop_codon:yes gene_type:complete
MMLPFMIFLNGVGSGDSLDTYWYNNAFAEGEQMYPQGISKYYDIYSLNGYLSYLIDYLLVIWIVEPIRWLMWPPFSFFPLETWIAWFTKDLDNWYNGIVVASIVNMFAPFGLHLAALSFFEIPLERGFAMG